jgi:predicted nucleic acid-binding protein
MKLYKPKVTVDTSAIVKWFKIEENREDALKLRNRVDRSLQAGIRRLEIFKYMIIVLE